MTTPAQWNEVAELRARVAALEGALKGIADAFGCECGEQARAAIESVAETMRERCLAAAQDATEQHPGDPHWLIQSIYSVRMSEVLAESLPPLAVQP